MSGSVFGSRDKEIDRVDVDVVVLHTADGFSVPIEIRWEDGSAYPVKVLSSCRAMCSGNYYAMKYVVDVRGRRRALWHDVADGRWFVEVPSKRREAVIGGGTSDPRFGDIPG